MSKSNPEKFLGFAKSNPQLWPVTPDFKFLANANPHILKNNGEINMQIWM